MLLAIDLYEDFINEDGVTITTMLTLQAVGINRSEFDTPQTDGFVGDCDAALSKKILNITMAQVKSVVEPNGITDDIGREPVTFVGIHPSILAISTH
jgi:hypothetical protein